MKIKQNDESSLFPPQAQPQNTYDSLKNIEM